jgi:hypothetical protein
VYVYDSAYGGTTCCGCLLDNGDIVVNDPLYGTHAEMIEHLRLHQKHGHHVPEYVFTELANSPDHPLEVSDL